MQQTILEPLDSPQMARWRINASVLRILIIFGFLFSYLGAQAQGNEFIIAAAKGDLSRVKALIAAKADVNATVDRGLTALMAASQWPYGCCAHTRRCTLQRECHNVRRRG
jgi:hypothetical protein